MNPLKLLKKAVSIQSLSKQEEKVSKYFVESMNNLGYNAERDEVGNAVGIKGEGNETILMLGHIDTVPGKIPVEIKDNKLYGRGSVDAKGPFCTFIMAGSKAKLKGKKLIVVGAVEEEYHTSKGAKHVLDKYDPDYIIIGEPSGYDAVTLGYKGRLLIDYILEKDMSHGASKEEGVIEQALRFYTQLRDNAIVYNSDKFGIFKEVQLKIQNINSGSDGIKDRIEMTLGYRLPVKYPVENLKKFIQKMKEDAHIKIYGWEKPIRAPSKNKLVRSFLKAIRKQDMKPRFKVKTGTSDMNILGEAFPEIPILAYGPGNSSLDHTPNEHIDLNEYETAIEILRDVLETL